MEIISLVIVPFLLAFSVFATVFALLVKRTSWSRLAKMFMFSFWVALFSFPQFISIPLPNIVPVAFLLFTEGIDGLFGLYKKTGDYTAAAYAATFMLAFAISPLIFAPQIAGAAASSEKSAAWSLRIRRWIGCALSAVGVFLFCLFALFLLVDLTIGMGVNGLIFKLPFVLLGGMSLWIGRLIKRVDGQGQK